MMRLFIAILLSNEVKRTLSKLCQRLGPNMPDWRWTREENIHLTVKFLGDVNENQLKDIEHCLNQSVKDQQIRSFPLQFNELGFFPSPKRPTIFWIGAHDPSGQLYKIAKNLDQNLESLGFKSEKHSYKGHITLARRSHQREKPKSIDPDFLNMKRGFAPFQVTMVTLVKSTLTHQGPIYHSIFNVKLRDA